MSITVRGIRPDDGDAIGAIYRQPTSCWGTLQLPYAATQLWRDRVAKPADGIHQLVACDGETIVGHLGLHVMQNPRRRHAGGIGMAVHADHRRRGVGRALMDAALELADGWYGLTRVELDVFVDNAPAIALYRACGFEVEGTHAAYAFRDGAYVDTYAMARLRVPGGAAHVTA